MKLCCGDCKYFLVLSCPPDRPDYFCHNEQSKSLSPPIGYLRGPDALTCKYFVPVDAIVSPGPSTARKLTLEQRFLDEPDQFIDVPTAAHLLRKSNSTIYTMVQENRLESVRVGTTIFVHRPSILKVIRSHEAA